MYALVCTRQVKRAAADEDQSNAAMITQQTSASAVATSLRSSAAQDAEAALDSLGSFSTQGVTTCTPLPLHSTYTPLTLYFQRVLWRGTFFSRLCSAVFPLMQRLSFPTLFCRHFLSFSPPSSSSPASSSLSLFPTPCTALQRKHCCSSSSR